MRTYLYAHHCFWSCRLCVCAYVHIYLRPALVIGVGNGPRLWQNVESSFTRKANWWSSRAPTQVRSRRTMGKDTRSVRTSFTSRKFQWENRAAKWALRPFVTEKETSRRMLVEPSEVRRGLDRRLFRVQAAARVWRERGGCELGARRAKAFESRLFW